MAYLDGRSFIEAGAAGWRPYERLAELTDEELAGAVQGAHGWSGRDLIAHMVAWQEDALAVARELAMSETSPANLRRDADWAARGDEVNEEITRTWRALPMADVQRRMSVAAAELQGLLPLVPETRWLKDGQMLRFLSVRTIVHYEAHRDDLQAVLAAARR